MAMRRDRQKILLLDDHPIYLAGLRQLIETRFPGVEISACHTVRSAIERLDRGERFQVMLIDLHLTRLDGFAFLQAARERRLLGKVIVVSGSEDPRDAEKALELGAIAFLSKEASSQELIATITAALQGDAPEQVEILSAGTKLRVAPGEGVARQDLLAQIGLSARQADVLSLVAAGYSNKEVAQTLSIAEPTVKSHVSAIFKVFRVQNRMSAVGKARMLGLVE